MSEQNWAPEPLELKEITYELYDSDYEILDKNGTPIVCADSPFHGVEWDEATAKRIVACYNACAGVPTEDLDYMANRKLMLEAIHKFLSTFKHQRVYNAIIPDTKEAPDAD